MNKEKKATIFALVMMSVVVMSILTAFNVSGPIVLGTEKNTNGHVEYLCLGSSCENLY